MSALPPLADLMVCQFCGRAASRASQPVGWLDQPRRDRWDVRVIRCPQHWSEWALRQTRTGRTKENRVAMAAALSMDVPTGIAPSHEPFDLPNWRGESDDVPAEGQEAAQAEGG